MEYLVCALESAVQTNERKGRRERKGIDRSIGRSLEKERKRKRFVASVQNEWREPVESTRGYLEHVVIERHFMVLARQYRSFRRQLARYARAW